MRLVLALLLVSLAPSAAAQDARLVLRDAVVEAASGGRYTKRDTDGMEAAPFDGGRVFLGEVLLRLGPGSVLVADVALDPHTVAPGVSVTFAPDAAEAFAQITRAHLEQTLAIVLDGRVLSAPRVNGVIDGGRLHIEGVTEDEAQELAAAIRSVTGAVTGEASADAAFDVSTPEAAAETFAHANGRRDWLRSARTLHPRALAYFCDQARRFLRIADGQVRAAPPTDGLPDSISIERLLGETPGTAWTDFSDVEATALYFAATAGTWTLSGGREMTPVGTLPDGTDAATVVLRPVDETEAVYEGIGMASPIVLRVERTADGWGVLYPTIGQQWQPSHGERIPHGD